MISRGVPRSTIDSEHYRKSFAGRYNCYYLVYYEGFATPSEAIQREKEIKKWRREKKNKLISDFNPHWDFLNWDVF